MKYGYIVFGMRGGGREGGGKIWNTDTAEGQACIHSVWFKGYQIKQLLTPRAEREGEEVRLRVGCARRFLPRVV